MSAARMQVRVTYEGDVQGVGFRFTTREIAMGIGVSGGVENMPDGTVRLVAEGTKDELERVLLKIRVSRLGGHIQGERTEWREAVGLAGFYCR